MGNSSRLSSSLRVSRAKALWSKCVFATHILQQICALYAPELTLVST